MLESLLNSFTSSAAANSDNTDWAAIRAKYPHNTALPFNNRIPAGSGVAYMAVYNNKMYYCTPTHIKVYDLLNDFAPQGIIEYKTIKPSMSLWGTQYVKDNLLYCGCDNTGTGLWVINVLTGDVVNIVISFKAGAIMIVDKTLYLACGTNSGIQYSRTIDPISPSWASGRYTGVTTVDQICGGCAMAVEDGKFVISGGGRGTEGGGVDYSNIWIYDPINGYHMTSIPTTLPILALSHNPVVAYKGYLYQFAPPGKTSTKFNINTGVGVSNRLNASGNHSIFTSKEGVVIMNASNFDALQMIIVD